MPLIETVLKLVLATALGGLIGIERETSQKPAGFRTNVLVCVGSAMMMILSDLVLQRTGGGQGELTRMAAGVVTGIGFIGAGTIIQARGMVHGLTTASTLWVVAGLGLVVGAGFYLEAVIFTGIVILTLVLFLKLEGHFHKRAAVRFHLRMKDSAEALGSLRKLSIHLGVKIEDFHLKREKDIAVVSFGLTASEDKEQEFSQSLSEIGDILEIKIE
jgi:putative Mg2+ transporter-C (MgtC) family protein